MPNFAFVANDAAGRRQSGMQDADSSADLLSRLRGRGWIVLEIRPFNQQNTPFRLPALFRPSHWLPATGMDAELGLLQIATMLRSGLTLLTALRTAAEQVRRPAMATVWRRIQNRIEEGSSLADAMAAEGNRFPDMIIQLVRVGEQTGTLDAVLTRGAEYLERHRTLRARVVNALYYPAIVLMAACGVTAFMVVGVIPKLQRFIMSRGRQLPAITQALLDVTSWINRYGMALGIGIILILAAFLLIRRTAAGRLAIDRTALELPILGNLFRLSGTTTAARGLSILLESGITLLGALETTAGLLVNRSMRRRVEQTRRSVMEGGTLAGGLGAGGEFLPMLSRMAAVGESTGTLDAVLTEVARFHEEQLAATIRRLAIFVEPAIIVIVGGIVGFVYIAFFVALFSVAGR